MTRMTLRKMSEMTKKPKKVVFDYTPILQNYQTAFDLDLLNRIALDLDIVPYLEAHRKVYCMDAECNHPAYIYDRTLALNVFEGCCYNDLTLKEKKLAVVAALFRQTKKPTVMEKVLDELVTNNGDVADLDELTFIDSVIAMNSRKKKPVKTDTVMRMVLWDAKYMHLYNPKLNPVDYLTELFSDKDLTDPSVSFQMTKLINAEYMTNWARLKAHKLNWPMIVKDIFKNMPQVKETLMSTRRLW